MQERLDKHFSSKPFSAAKSTKLVQTENIRRERGREVPISSTQHSGDPPLNSTQSEVW